jgi:hypothetical protein
MTNHPNRRKAIYATRDYDGGRIAQDATIIKFTTPEAAREWLLAPYQRGGGWNLDTAKIAPSTEYSDCWIKSFDRPRIGVSWIAPFSLTQLFVQAPGEHPGGRQHWTTPNVDVLVVSEIYEVVG